MSRIIIGQPNITDIFRMGNVYEIKWETVGPMDDHVSILLRESAVGEILEIESSFENIGSYFWEVPKNLDESVDYYIRIETTDPVVGNSQNFEIKEKFSIDEYLDLEHWEKIVLVEMEARTLIDTTFVGNRYLLQENGDYLLQEDGDKIVLEQSISS